MKRLMLFISLFLTLFLSGLCYADTALTETQYRSQMSTEFLPEPLTVNVFSDCGDYQIRILGQPLVTAATSGLNASGDKSFLILRVGIKNMTEEPIIWLDPDSFHVQEYYLDITGQTYDLNYPMSAKAAQAYNIPAFYSIIGPQQELTTMLVFEIYGEVDGWIMTFSPYTREMEGSQNEYSFTLPKFIRQ